MQAHEKSRLTPYHRSIIRMEAYKAFSPHRYAASMINADEIPVLHDDSVLLWKEMN
jgi:hypothetical protein